MSYGFIYINGAHLKRGLFIVRVVFSVLYFIFIYFYFPYFISLKVLLALMLTFLWTSLNCFFPDKRTKQKAAELVDPDGVND